MTNTLMDAAAKAYKLGQAHSYLRKIEKIFVDLNLDTPEISREVRDLLEFCNKRCMELRETA